MRRNGRAVSGFYPFLFYLEPLLGSLPARPVSHLFDVVTAVVPASVDAYAGHEVAPFIDWTTVTSWESFLANCRSLPGVDSVETVERKRRAIEKKLGTFELVLDDDRDGVFETLLRWKREQYARSPGFNPLASPRALQFYRELRGRGVLHVTSCWAGGSLLGGNLYLLSGDRRMTRTTVYSPGFAPLSPGSVMSLAVLRASFEAGDREFDYLFGRESYKFTYATHMRVLEQVGKEPRLDRLVRTARGIAGSVVHEHRIPIAPAQWRRRGGALAGRITRG